MTTQEQLRAAKKREVNLRTAIEHARDISTLRRLTSELHDAELDVLRIEQKLLYAKLQQRATSVAMTTYSTRLH